jgi:CHASE2 domain-containing sensor protein
MKNTEHKKKMVAPIIIAVLFLLYLIGYGIAIAVTTEWSPVLILVAIPLAGLGIGMIVVLKSRIKEIRSGEEDDLSNY